MIKIAVTAALAAIVIADVASVPAAAPASRSIERPRGLKGDRLPVLAPKTGCADVAWPHQQGECVRGRQQPVEQMPSARSVRIVTAGLTAVAN